MRVVVLMSTYNGEKFIEEQINSILSQLPKNGLLMIRDDGSTDNTVEKISSYSDNRINLKIAENIGFAKSFLTLLTNAPSEAEMVMFSDQDDVWLEGKISRAWKFLSSIDDRPALYCSRQLIADENLKILETSSAYANEKFFPQSITDNIVTGCTAAINQSAVALLKRAGVPDHVKFHDWWLYVVVSLHGKIIVDQEATILYRQHSTNFIGRGAGKFDEAIKKLQFILHNDWVGALIGQIEELKKYYWISISDSDKKTIEERVAFKRNKGFVKFKFIIGSEKLSEIFPKDIAIRLLLITRYVSQYIKLIIGH